MAEFVAGPIPHGQRDGRRYPLSAHRHRRRRGPDRGDPCLVRLRPAAGPRRPARAKGLRRRGASPTGRGARDGFLAWAPDLAIDLVAPTGDPGYVRAKVTASRDAGCRLVWVVDQGKETVTVWTPDRRSRVCRDDDVVDGGDVLPGYTVAVSEVFGSTW
ncbi:MAG: Uma2 family endonuclease [Chloroflexia bacterium]|nr:Uma2 family endonuclease [Chloroflexia bacterium]